MIQQSHTQQQPHQQKQIVQKIQSQGGLHQIPTPLPHKTNPYHQQPPQTPTPPQGHHQHSHHQQQQLPLRSGNQNLYPPQHMGMPCNQNALPSRGYPSGATPPAPNPIPHKTNPYNQPQPNACRTPPSAAAQGTANPYGLPPTSDGS